MKRKKGSARDRRIVDVFLRHQLKIARATLKLSDAGALILGGMTKEQARALLRLHGRK